MQTQPYKVRWCDTIVYDKTRKSRDQKLWEYKIHVSNSKQMPDLKILVLDALDEKIDLFCDENTLIKHLKMI